MEKVELKNVEKVKLKMKMWKKSSSKCEKSRIQKILKNIKFKLKKVKLKNVEKVKFKMRKKSG